MKTIYKYQVEPEGTIIVQEDFQPLRAAAQGEEICIWGTCTPVKEMQSTRDLSVKIVGTGHIIDGLEDLTYLNTFGMSGWLVFHAFYRWAK